MREIKNYDNLTKEDLIFSLLKSESNPAEHNYIKYFNNTNDELKSKINYIRILRSGNIITKKERKLKKDLWNGKKKDNLSDNEKEKIYNDLVKLANTLDKEEKYKIIGHDDLDYFGIRELEGLFDYTGIDNDDYYKPVLVKSSFKNNYQ